MLQVIRSIWRPDIPNQIIKFFLGFNSLFSKPYFSQKAYRPNQRKQKDKGHAWLPSIYTTPHACATTLQLRRQKWTPHYMWRESNLFYMLQSSMDAYVVLSTRQQLRFLWRSHSQMWCDVAGNQAKQYDFLHRSSITTKELHSTITNSKDQGIGSLLAVLGRRILLSVQGSHHTADSL